jgi:hypothetical protein
VKIGPNAGAVTGGTSGGRIRSSMTTVLPTAASALTLVAHEKTPVHTSADEAFA